MCACVFVQTEELKNHNKTRLFYFHNNILSIQLLYFIISRIVANEYPNLLFAGFMDLGLIDSKAKPGGSIGSPFFNSLTVQGTPLSRGFKLKTMHRKLGS